jgi:hypothetical protein
MNIQNLLNQNLESFYPWSDSDTPPLDTKKLLYKKKKIEKNCSRVGEPLCKTCSCKSLTINDLQRQGGPLRKSLTINNLAMLYN